MQTTHPIKSIRRAGVPLVAWTTADPAYSIQEVCKNIPAEVILLQWDFIHGLAGLNSLGKAYLEMESQSDEGFDSMQTLNPTECLAKLEKFKKLSNAIVFFHSFHAIIKDESAIQAVWNLRDNFKAKNCSIIGLCAMVELPAYIAHDIVVINEPLPEQAQLKKLVSQISTDAEIKLSEEEQSLYADTLAGLSGFEAEQAFCMSLSKDGVDKSILWRNKKQLIENTKGLSVWKGSESFEDIGGLDNLKTFFTRILSSPTNPVRCIGFIDEIEKLFAGSQSDTSGVSQDQLRVFLAYMQDYSIPGVILIGPPGTGKSMIAKACGKVAQSEVIAMDTGAMKGSLVGESEGMIRKAMDTFNAISQGKGLFIATCNKITSLPPELRRRFSLGTFFVDLPLRAEQQQIWKHYLASYKLPEQSLPEHNGWTGAEIKACCDIAFRGNWTLQEAASFIVPVCRSAAKQIKELRQMASGAFISANEPGIYQYREENESETKPIIARKVNLGN